MAEERVPLEIRRAEPEDAAELLSIYAPYVEESWVTFECVPPTVEEFRRRMEEFSRHYPYLVCCRAGEILGYAYAHRQAERAAYQWNAELSIYLAPAAVGKGYGRRLYQALLDLLSLQGVRTVYGVVTSPNPASEALQKSLGFRLIGVHKNTGYKAGQWRDVLWFEKSLAPYDADPQPVLPFCQLDQQQVDRVLAAYGHEDPPA